MTNLVRPSTTWGGRRPHDRLCQDPERSRQAVWEKRPSNLTIICFTIALVTDLELARKHPDWVLFILKALTDAQLSDAIAELPESRAPNRWAS